MSSFSVWFRRVMYLGILVDWILAIPSIFAPVWVLNLLGLKPTGDPVWTALGALLLFLASVFYFPGARQPTQLRYNAWFAVLARLAAAVFFLVLHPGTYPLLGWMDAILFLIQLPLLLLTLRGVPPYQPDLSRTPQIPPEQISPAKWLHWFIWIGILFNWVLGASLLLQPEETLNLLDWRATQDPLWAAFVGFDLLLLGFAFVPGGTHPFRIPMNRLNVWQAVLTRLPVALFFWLIWPGTYSQLGGLHALIFFIQIPFLLNTMQLIPKRYFWDTDTFDYKGTTFQYVKDGAWQGPLDELPHYFPLGALTRQAQFFNDCARTLRDLRDIRPYFDKLIHSHGVAFSGIWKIDQDSPYTGYFKKGSEGLLITRISAAGPFITRGFPRTIGFAGKIFPTLNPQEWVWPANFVTITHLSGVWNRYVLDVVVSNYPTTGWNPAILFTKWVSFRLVDTRPGYRQVYAISSLGVKPGEPVVTPDLMKLTVAKGTPRVAAKDFRNEIRLKNYPDHKLVYDISVRGFEGDEWIKLGTITLTEDVVSVGCDKHLHFWTPRDMPNVANSDPAKG